MWLSYQVDKLDMYTAILAGTMTMDSCYENPGIQIMSVRLLNNMVFGLRLITNGIWGLNCVVCHQIFKTAQFMPKMLQASDTPLSLCYYLLVLVDFDLAASRPVVENDKNNQY